MCLIIYKPDNEQIPAELVKSAYEQNRDGWGIMHAEQGELNVFKGNGLKELLSCVENVQNKADVFVHLRMATHGTICAQNTHPFDVAIDEDGDRIISMMHNGVIHNVQQIEDKNASDTRRFAQMIESFLSKSPDLIFDPGIQQLIENFIGPGNKLTFLNRAGGYFIANAQEGIDWRGLWLSNTYAWDYYNQDLIAEGTWSSCASHENLSIEELFCLDEAEILELIDYNPDLIYQAIRGVRNNHFFRTPRGINLRYYSPLELWNELKHNSDKIFQILVDEAKAHSYYLTK